ncbi:radical SAM/SPASM domain-containing protein [Aeoliella mucimassa]|uniref:Antilisterial bacteriocin subtilosin biosynthesis protein AlbA n=1 Tax=Aeoliella mucimassa TaxID=2527972 RepID=A0A518AT36_9BACT|nr:radical SAM protein [Aeoliella mucimassa]QDU57904.1 Antilisterial bacteriocin subtilosin biosynthesis protein AlbA [Aeoliella mucimassa]
MLTHRQDVQAMLSDYKYLQFIVDMDREFRNDPSYRSRSQLKILEGAARGERIIPFDDKYVVSSFFPPMPSPAFKTFLSGAANTETMFSDLSQGRRSAPLSTHVCITTRCQYRCEHCGATTPDKCSELSRDQWKKVFADLQDLGVAYFGISGGEPLLRRDLEEIIRSIDDRSTTLLFTNARALSPERAESLKESGLFYLAVSLDSPDEKEHNRFRRNPRAYEYALTGIENSSRAGLYTIVSAVVYKNLLTRDNLLQLFRTAGEHGAHEVRIHQPVPSGELSDTEEAEDIFYTPDDIKMLHDLQFEINELRLDLPKVSSFTFTEGPEKFGCGAGVMHSYISSTGELWPCDFVPASFGNVLEQPVAELYQKMNCAARAPRTECLARTAARQLQGKNLPLVGDEAVELCANCNSGQLPRFFADLKSGDMHAA